ncbi:iron ABC transporter substrate-binding protein [Microcella daejeonensis]|uniref:Iron ABC transporter substrate-binding protein n=1 Tax=Microcella daejeonensis TaxID=2994971 RepID=A0A9E8S994_9MICO|nr:iron ABC transporter substrate-binding protein [Microcella daejeonensis]WAB82430.1 iron ABC transporter substrate-binding protein [Microcella daejeonensis]
MRTSRSLSLLALGAASALVLGGCAAGDSASTDSGSGDADLTLYSGRDEALVQPLIDQFTEETGIEVEVRYGNTAELGALLLEEGEATPADVFLSQDAGALGALANADLFTTLPDDIAGAVDAGFTSTDGSWVGITGRARVVVFDGEKYTAEELPDDIDDYTEEEWRGLVGVAPTNASFQSFVTAYRVLESEGDAEEFLTELAANDPQIFEGNNPILTAVDEGALDVGLINHYYWFRQAAEVGADNMRAQLKFLEAGDPGSIVNVTGAGLMSGSADNADALAFIEYLVSEAGQSYFVEETFEYPLVAGIDAPEGLPSLESLVNPELDLSDLDTLSDTQDLLARVGLI